ncbi:urate hydroxylase PuuD [Paraglaciecola aquimarina]|uniref:Urate hydroxylase PuuD n=1 Tax=Paraglaciecola algarum TaxID=3050085 RepID=A0ABS9D7F7_9ALTE|nr:urate hydroxylase PuuD [Paraglaciecola sp. G1-23]MCF2948715.1 urate hydroxylase PuuD [Paraglaciecola sp. G1-23]
MTTFIDWLNLGFRWFHVVAAIAWIGASFYFIWLDLSLREPPKWKKDKGVKGDLWAIHGGGIYEVAKYQLRPDEMPKTLHWFKWEAYSTWLSGTALLVVLYYLQAQSYLVGSNTWIQSPNLAIAASVGFIVGAQLIYELLLRTPLVKKGLMFALSLVVLITIASWLAHNLFSARAAYLHVGAMMATWMAGNVFWGIMPAQRKFVDAVSKNQTPDENLALFAKLRSTHNNYLTLPVIFCMISNHYPFVYGHEFGWLAVVAIGCCLAWGRHYFNLKHTGNKQPMVAISSLIGLVLVAVTLSFTKPKPSLAIDASTQNSAAQSQLSLAKLTVKTDLLVQIHCANCHSNTPTQAGFTAPPAGIVIDSLETLSQQSAKATEAIQSGYMPLGNMTQLTDDERANMLIWLATNTKD